MSDGQPAQAPERPVYILTIEFNAGQTRATGPLTNKHLCYGMLENARDIVQKAADKGAGEGARSGVLVVPRLGIKQ